MSKLEKYIEESSKLKDMIAAFETMNRIEKEDMADYFKNKILTGGVEAVSWRQYTPYFNDGDACYFRRGDLHIGVRITEENEDSDDFDRDNDGLGTCGDFGFPYSTPFEDSIEYDRESKSHLYKNEDDRIKHEAIRQAYEYYGLIPDDIVMQIFDNHVRVYAVLTPGGEVNFTIEEFDHD